MFCTLLFVRPIYKILIEGADVSKQAAGYHRLLQSMWMSLLGSLLAVLSSTVLYGNEFYFFLNNQTPGHPAVANPFLNIFVFGINMDSMCNDIGVLLVCGVLKNVSFRNVGSTLGSLLPTKKLTGRQHVPTVAPEPVPVFDSRAYEE